MSERANPLGDLTDFAPKPAPVKQRPPVESINALAAAHGFPSREGKPADEPKHGKARRYRTGRNQQFNIKASAETIERVTRIADSLDLPIGAVLELAIEALEKTRGV